MRRIQTILTALVMAVFILPTASAQTLSDTLEATAAYVLDTVSDPQVASVGGEWAVLGLARSGAEVPQSYWDGYYATLVETVEGCEGVLHQRKYTEYSRVVLTLTALGGNPAQVAGYDLVAPLSDWEATVWQGVNGAIWALLALDSGNYDQTAADWYLQYLLDSQLEGGGWTLSGTTADPDLTGMALQALSGHRENAQVEEAIQQALSAMSQQQDETGGFTSWGSQSVESVAQMIQALAVLDIPLEDSRFVKGDATLWDGLMDFYLGDGGFAHTLGDQADLMSTEQALCALVALQRMEGGESGFYTMDDVTIQLTGEDSAVGLAGKHPDVQRMEGVRDGVLFPDVDNDETGQAILALSTRQILSGNPDGNFYPDNTMTRAEFATIVVNALGLPLGSTTNFSDVQGDDWFAPYVGTASTYGIVSGVSDTEFNPQGTITRQEAAAMVARAAALCGMDADLDDAVVEDCLALFADGDSVSHWAKTSVAFCYLSNLWTEDGVIASGDTISRGEMALMVYRMLDGAKLL